MASNNNTIAHDVDQKPSIDVKKIILPEGARAILVSLNHDGSESIQAVSDSASVLDIERDLRSHLNEYPYPDDWLIQLRDYIDQRLSARRDTRNAGGFCVPTHGGAVWEMAGFEKVEVLGEVAA